MGAADISSVRELIKVVCESGDIQINGFGLVDGPAASPATIKMLAPGTRSSHF